MKKAIFIMILLCLGTTAGAYYVIYEPFTEKLAAEQILPGETLLTIRIDQLKHHIDDFRASPLGAAIAGIDVQKALTALEAPADSIQEAQDLIARTHDSIDSSWFDVLFGQQVTLALLPVTINDFDQPSPAELSQALVFVLRPKHPAKFLDLMKHFFANANDIEVTSDDYDQWTVNRVESKARGTVHYSIAGGLVVCALHRRPVLRCLDALKDPVSSLAQNPDYQAVERELTDNPAPQIYGYANLAEFLALALGMAAKNAADRPELDLLEKQFGRMGGFYAAGYALYGDGSPVQQSKLVFMVDRTAVEPQLERVLNIRPETADMLTLLPQNTLGFTWQNTLDLELYYNSLLESEDPKLPSIASVNPLVQEKLGVSFEELADAFGPQWGMALQDIKTGGFFPIPEVGIFIQSARPEIMEQIIQRAAGTGNMALQTENYGPHQIFYLPLPFGSELSPGYAYLNGYCILAVNTQTIKSYIDAFTNGQNITGSEAFMAVDKGLSAQNNQLAFIKFDRVLERIPEIIQWGGSMAAMVQPDKAGQIAPVADQVINPLIDGLKMYKTIGCRTFFAEAKVESQMYMEVDY